MQRLLTLTAVQMDVVNLADDEEELGDKRILVC